MLGQFRAEVGDRGAAAAASQFHQVHFHPFASCRNELLCLAEAPILEKLCLDPLGSFRDDAVDEFPAPENTLVSSPMRTMHPSGPDLRPSTQRSDQSATHQLRAPAKRGPIDDVLAVGSASLSRARPEPFEHVASVLPVTLRLS